MSNIFKKYLNSFIEQPALWFFYVFLVTSMLSIRKVLFFYPINGTFNEYTGIYVYLSDILLFITIMTWLLSLCNKFNILSIYNHLSLKQLFHVEQFMHIKKLYQHIIHNFFIFFPLFLVFFSFLSTLWAINPNIAFFRSIKLLEFVLLYFFILQNVPRGTFSSIHKFKKKCSACKILKKVLLIFIFSGLAQGIIGITQFLIQQSLGLTWLRESIISTQMPGVAKIIFNNHVFIRAYGLFPHPNIFGGFLVLSIFCTLAYLKIFCPNINVPRGTLQKTKTENFWKITLFLALIIEILALALTFSKSAIIGLFIAIFYLHFFRTYLSVLQNVPRGTFLHNLIKMFHVEHFKRSVLLILGIMLLLIALLLNFDKNSLLIKSFNERIFYLNVSRGTFLSDPLFGIGSGQFVPNMTNISNIQAWQFQPVHNVFLLIINEFGILILFLFIYFLFKLFSIHYFTEDCSTWNNSIKTRNKIVPRGTIFCANKKIGGELFHVEQSATTCMILLYFKAILLSFIFIMLFDHYFWDIQQGQIMLWTVFAIIITSKMNKSIT